MDFSLQMFDM